MATVSVHTAHNVRIDYQTATVGARIGAFCVDLLIVTGVYVFVLYVLDQYRVGIDGAVVFRLVPLFWLLGYFFGWEMLGRGQTPGKWLLRLRVIRPDGRDPTPADFLIRAVFLLPDVVFTFGMAAILSIVLGRHRQRLGDLVARTVVIQTHNRETVSLAEIRQIRQRDEHRPSFPAVQRLSEEDMLVVKQSLFRYRRYPNEAHRGALELLADRLAGLLDVRRTERGDSSERFLETLLLDYIVLTR
ncbi:RDD family protein [Lewinella sp. JB7]|uniref:RDD family protein n=1 Tax=Lewinella sp. JB7 TaxID=2962887 RepID=UPI0020C9C651|nr:RDD family protein [Lewinella sp. JB7]MCP9237382.1 RDD family protein [Lewinella sp. JB7]